MGLVQGGRTRVSDGDEDYMRKKRPWNGGGLVKRIWVVVFVLLLFLQSAGVAKGWKLVLWRGRVGKRRKNQHRTPKYVAQRLRREALEDLQHYLDGKENGWKPVLFQGGGVISTKMSVWTRHVPESDYVEVKASARIPASPEAVSEVLTPGDIDIVRTYNPLIKDGYDVEYLDRDAKISWGLSESIGLIHARDFITYICRSKLPGGGVALTQRATDHPDAPSRPGAVRGRIHGTFLISPVYGCPHATDFTMVHRFDAGGAIPPWLVNWLAQMKPAGFISSVWNTAKKYDAFVEKVGSHPCQGRSFAAPHCNWFSDTSKISEDTLDDKRDRDGTTLESDQNRYGVHGTSILTVVFTVLGSIVGMTAMWKLHKEGQLLQNGNDM